MVNLKYLKIPESRIYEVSDVFTRIDDLLTQVVIGLDMVIDMLYNIAQRYGYEQVTIAPPSPTGVAETVVKNALFISGVSEIDTFDVEVTPNDYKKVTLYGNGVIITAEDDVIIAGKPNAPGFPLYATTYMVITRTGELKYLYIKSATSSNVKVHVMVLK